ncbi:hypothetical protein C8Q77DRAFT_1130011 [Trametes polyzona]|nr:hypothetical protein C8Q77DRAFT_1130011 [Trametes polyzona]
MLNRHEGSKRECTEAVCNVGHSLKKKSIYEIATCDDHVGFSGSTIGNAQERRTSSKCYRLPPAGRNNA